MNYRLLFAFASLLTLVTFLSSDCTNPGRSKTKSAADSLYLVLSGDKPKYDIKNLEQKYFLPYVLEEISALSYYKDDILACVQDEDGKVFFYNLQTEEIGHTTLLEYSSDYEGIEIVGDRGYILKYALIK